MTDKKLKYELFKICCYHNIKINHLNNKLSNNSMSQKDISSSDSIAQLSQNFAKLSQNLKEVKKHKDENMNSLQELSNLLKLGRAENNMDSKKNEIQEVFDQLKKNNPSKSDMIDMIINDFFEKTNKNISSAQDVDPKSN
jgi:hypothetical protein